MTAFEQLVESVKEAEGFSERAYWDEKHFSIGYGTPAKNKAEVITKEEAELRMLAILKPIWETKLPELLGTSYVSEGRKIALAHMMYQLGVEGARNFKEMCKWIERITPVELDQWRWAEIAFHASDSLWRGQTPKRARWVCKMLYTGVFTPYRK